MDSAPLNSKDQALFADMGYTLLFEVVSVVCEMGLWGIYLIPFAWAVALQLSRRKLDNLASIGVLAATIILFLSSTALLAMNTSWLIISLRGFLKYTNLDWSERILQVNEDVISLGIPEEALFLVNVRVYHSNC
ncbi:hypothetical protein PM082_001418 [Marasmius tenuissimus]|nr:hypothetical protein PM082_001418 [Marasmius tenuissimus]